MKVCSVCDRCYDDSVAFCTEENHPALSESFPGDPEMISGYRLEHLLESGVANDTYRARQVVSGRSCLVRISSADENIDEYLSEAKLAATLFHPNVVDTYDFGELDGKGCYVVQEEAEGKTLREFLNDVGSPELLTSIEIVRQIAEALDPLHLSGLKHGAIRPENIVLTKDHERNLLVRIQNPDLGGVIARSIISNKFLADSALNQLKYFSPEQCSGAATSPQSDVYSLGIVFYELLAGAPPFDATKAIGLIEKHKSHRVPDIRINNFHLRMLVTHSLTETLQKQPRLRQSSANVFARQLRHIEQLATHVSTPPPATAAPAWRPLPAMPAQPSVVEPPPVAIEPSPGLSMRAADSRPTPVDLVSDLPDEKISSPIINPEPAIVLDSVSTHIEGESPRAIDFVIEPATTSSTTEVPTRDDEVGAQIDDVVSTMPVIEPPAAKESISLTPRSRLKLWKKKLRSIASSLAPETGSRQVTSIFDSVDRSILNRTSHELPSFEPKTLDADKVPVQTNRKKIEWNMPEDDIPARDVVLQALLKEGKPPLEEFAQAEEKPFTAPAVELPPSDVAEVPEALATMEDADAAEIALLRKEKAFETLFRTTPQTIPQIREEIEAPIEVKAPVVNKWPVTADTPATGAEEETVEVKAANKHSRKPYPTLVPKAKSRPETTPRPKSAEPAIAGAAPSRPSVNVRPKANSRKPAAKKSGLGFPVNLADLEEITHVRPASKRIRVQLEQVAAQPEKSNPSVTKPSNAAPREIAFSPTILGRAAEPKTVDRNQNKEILSALNSEADLLGPERNRSVVLGAGIAALIVLFLLGFGLAASYLQTSNSADSTSSSSQASQQESITLPVAETVLPVKKTAPKDSAKASPDAKPTETKEAETSGAKDGIRTVPERSIGEKNADVKTRPESSKTVPPKTITAAAAGKTTAKASIQKQTARSPGPAPTGKVNDSTRPRIVINAKP